MVALAALAGSAGQFRGTTGDHDPPHVLAETMQHGAASIVLATHARRLPARGVETDDAVAFSIGVILVIRCRIGIQLVLAFAPHGAWHSLSAPRREAA